MDVSHVSCGDVLFVPPIFCPICIGSHTHNSRRDVPDVLAPSNRPGHFRGIPTSSFLRVFCLLFFALKPGTLHTCLRHFQASFRQFQISSAIVVAIYGNFRGTCAQMFRANLFVLCAVWAVFKKPASNFQLMPVWRAFVGNFPTCHAHVRRQAF